MARRLTLLAFIVSTVLAGNNAIAVRFSNQELPPFFGASLRFGAAALILGVVVLALRLPWPRGRALSGAFVFGALQYGLSYTLIYWSLQSVPAGLFQVVLALAPLLTFLLAIAHRQEPWQWRVLIGGLIALAGIALIFGEQLGSGAPLLRLLAGILAAACFAESTVLFKTFPQTHPITTNAVAMSIGAAMLLLFSWIAREAPRLPTMPATWLAVGYLIFFGSIATFVLALYVLKRWPASVSAYQLVLIPIVTVLSAAWLTHEPVTPALLAGGLLVLAGVYVGAIARADQLTAWWPRPRRKPHRRA
jgi:drug/metabolite transporter (DMT)-like permease